MSFIFTCLVLFVEWLIIVSCFGFVTLTLSLTRCVCVCAPVVSVARFYFFKQKKKTKSWLVYLITVTYCVISWCSCQICIPSSHNALKSDFIIQRDTAIGSGEDKAKSETTTTSNQNLTKRKKYYEKTQ